jgi:FtsP/CotA-like multicopper oxidase with cupredoxin domain
VNGRVQPLVRGALAGQFERWRIVNAAPAGLIRFGFRLLLPDAPDLSTIPADEQQQWIERYCAGPMLPAWQMAHDGLTRSEIRRAEQSTVAPGGRLDLLTRFPEPGRYCLLQMSETGTGNSDALGLIDVTGRAVRAADDADAELRRLLIRAAGRALRGERHAAVRGRVLADLENELRLGAFVPHPAITNAELTGHQVLEFRTVGPEHAMTFEVDRRRFDHGRIDRFVPLGGVEEWRLSVPPDGSRHTFHIHVNPFQIVSIRNDRGEDMTDLASPGFNADYAGLPAQWLDSIVLYPGTTVVMRTRYERFIGDTMLHCHVAHHADLGMMQHVRIYIPGSPEGPAAPQHQHGAGARH